MWHSLFGAARPARPARPARHPRRFVPGVEPLDDRIVPAITTTFSAGVLSIASNAFPDTIQVTTGLFGDILVNGVTTGATVTTATSVGVSGGGGNDTIDLSGLTGYAGPVTLDGGANNDTLIGSPGDDVLLDGPGVDTFDGGLGTDTLVGGAVANVFAVTGLNAGDLNGQGFAGVENLTGNVLADTFDLQPFGLVQGTVDGGLGTDTVSYASRASFTIVNLASGFATSTGGITRVENVLGSQGFDILTGDGQDNVLEGNGGTDFLRGGGGNDTLNGGAGNDTLFDEGGADTFIGGADSDTLVGDVTDDTFNILTADSGYLNTQQFSSVENLAGNDGDDTFKFSQLGIASLSGTIDGDAGVNTVDYALRTTAVVVDLTAGSATAVGGGAAGQVSGIQNVLGTQFDDTLTGNGEDNVLVGNGGADVLTGGAGRDILIGGTGGDTLFGDGAQDILIGGSTIYDSSPADLNNIRSVWGGSGLYIDRVTTLRSGMLAPANVTDDGTADTFTGGAGTDWFLPGALDTITDFVFGEELN